MLCCLAVLGLWKLAELAYPLLPARQQLELARTRAAIQSRVGVAPVRVAEPRTIEPINPSDVSNVVYFVPYRNPQADDPRDANAPPGCVRRDFYACATESTRTMPAELMWTTAWSLNGGHLAERQDNADGITVTLHGEPEVWLESLPQRLVAGDSPALRMRARADGPRRAVLQLQRAFQDRPIHASTLALTADWTDLTLLTPPVEEEGRYFFRLLLGEEPGSVEFTRLACAAGNLADSEIRFPRHFIERHTNRHGDRDIEPDPKLEATALRIACFGDSFTEGCGVAMEDTFPKQLEKLLRARGTTPVVVYNCGRGGANLAEILECFERRVEAANPHLVIVALCQNDFEMPELANQWREEYRDDFPGLTKVLRDYCLITGFGPAFEYLGSIESQCRAAGRRFVLCGFQTDSMAESFRMDQDARQFAADRDAPYFNPADALATAGVFDNAARCSPCEAHPNAAAHRILSEGLADLLESRDLLRITPLTDAGESAP